MLKEKSKIEARRKNHLDEGVCDTVLCQCPLQAVFGQSDSDEAAKRRVSGLCIAPRTKCELVQRNGEDSTAELPDGRLFMPSCPARPVPWYWQSLVQTSGVAADEQRGARDDGW